MHLVIQGKYIKIDNYIEIVEENPITNNFERQLSAYSNTFEIPYFGEISEVIDVSQLRKTSSPYLLIDCHIVDGVLLFPANLIIQNYDPFKNVLKVAICEKVEAGKGLDGFDVRKTKLTELRHKLKRDGVVTGEETDEVIFSNRHLDTGFYNEQAVYDYGITVSYPHAITPINSAPAINFNFFNTFLNQRYGVSMVNFPANLCVFANQQKPHPGDSVTFKFDEVLNVNAVQEENYIYPKILENYPAGMDVDAFMEYTADEKSIRFFSKDSVQNGSQGYLIAIRLEVTLLPGAAPIDMTNYEMRFNGYLMDRLYLGENVVLFTLPKNTELNFTGSKTKKAIELCFKLNNLDLKEDYRILGYDRTLYVDMQDNTTQAKQQNSRQIFQNLPDITVIDFLKEIAKATGKYIELSGSSIIFKEISESLQPGSIVDATSFFEETGNVEFSLYDNSTLEYWYKEAQTATLVVPISDETVKREAKKIEINILRTDDSNVNLFTNDGVTPLVGIATFPFLDITSKANDLKNFYLSIQNPFVISAKFRNFDFDLKNSILVRQLNGVFLPLKIIRTNKNEIELKLLKLES